MAPAAFATSDLQTTTSLLSQITSSSTTDDWRRDVGTSWPWLIIVLAILCFIAGWMSPLYEVDLPMHLRTGEWMAAHRAVPFVEPFAWTRVGAPFYAYSWFAELVYWGLFVAFDANGLHLLQAFTGAGAFLVIFWLGRTSGWSPWGTLLTALLSFGVWMSFIAAVRPQTLMGLTVPLSWIGAEWTLRGRVRDGVALSVLAAALTVNTHLLFPVTAVPLVRLLVEEHVNWRAGALFVLANVVGWCITPYLLASVDIMRLNFAGSLLIGPRTTVAELEPGWRTFLHAALSIRIAAVALLVAPFVIPARLISDRERILYGFAWAAGAFLFGTAVRGIVIWLLVALPLMSRAFASIPLPQLPRTRRLNAAVSLLAPLGLIGGSLRARETAPIVVATRETRQLPVAASIVTEPLVRVLECQTRVGDDTKAFVAFNYASYLVWRLPSVRYQIDGRNIYPDSVSIAEAYQVAADGPLQTGPWQSADVAILPMKYAQSQLLAASPAWMRLRVSVPTDSTDQPAALWATRRWMSTHSATPDTWREDTVRVGRVVAQRAGC